MRREGGGGNLRGRGSSTKREIHVVVVVAEVLFYVHSNHRLIRDGSPERPPRLRNACCFCFVFIYILHDCV